MSSRIMAQAIAVVCGLITRCRGAVNLLIIRCGEVCSLIVVGGAATNQLIMGKRPVDVVDLTGTLMNVSATLSLCGQVSRASQRCSLG